MAAYLTLLFTLIQERQYVALHSNRLGVNTALHWIRCHVVPCIVLHCAFYYMARLHYSVNVAQWINNNNTHLMAFFSGQSG